MGNISVQVLDEKDYEMVMAVLKPLIEDNTIRILAEEEDEDSIALPGPPLTEAQWVEHIRKAEASGIVSGEEAKAFFEEIKNSRKIAELV